MKSKPLIILTLISAVCLVGVHMFSKKFSDANTTGFQTNLEDALDSARSSGKPILLYFWGAW